MRSPSFIVQFKATFFVTDVAMTLNVLNIICVESVPPERLANVGMNMSLHPLELVPRQPPPMKAEVFSLLQLLLLRLVHFCVLSMKQTVKYSKKGTGKEYVLELM
jgi:hypothetical protein